MGIAVFQFEVQVERNKEISGCVTRRMEQGELQFGAPVERKREVFCLGYL